MEDLPLPPLDLANRVGCLDGTGDPWPRYLRIGAESRAGILTALPESWTLEGKRVLDFGCGAGRTLRHFIADTPSAEFSGCDIDEPSVAWLRANLSPPLRVFVNLSEPPLDVPDGAFDLVYAISVFTHLTDNWAEWLLELDRVLAEDGLLLVTVIGEGAISWVSNEPWDDARVGMNVLRYGQSWDLGGPMVIHSPWWIRAHWGRLFEIVDLQPSGFGAIPGHGHGTVLMRKRGQTCTVSELLAPERNEAREAISLEHNRRQLFAEITTARAGHEHLSCELAEARAQIHRIEAAREHFEHRLNAVLSSRSWRATAPLRRAASRLRVRPRRSG